MGTCTLNDGLVVNQQQIGNNYITTPQVKDILKQQIETKVIPQIEKDKGHVYVYSGQGITKDNIQDIMKNDDLDREQEVARGFKEYINLKKQFNDKKLQKTLQHLKQTHDEKTWEILQQKIHEHENKNK